MDDPFCATGGIVLLEMYGDIEKCEALRDKLNSLDGIEVQEMIFEHS